MAAVLSLRLPEAVGDVISHRSSSPSNSCSLPYLFIDSVSISMADNNKKMTKEELDQKRDVPFSR